MERLARGAGGRQTATAAGALVALAVCGAVAVQHHARRAGEQGQDAPPQSVADFAREHASLDRHSHPIVSVMASLDRAGDDLVYGPNQMNYENSAFPRSVIGSAQARASRRAFVAATMRAGATGIGFWAPMPHAHGAVPAQVTYTGRPSHVAGRTTAISVAPNGRTTYVGTAGGGVWKTHDITAAKPTWSPLSEGLPSRAIGTRALSGGVLYVGTGEPNGSADSEAGVGLFRSTDGGHTYSEVRGFHQYAQDRSVDSVAVDPIDPQHLLVGTTLARHGGASRYADGMAPPGAAPLGLYETRDAGATWTQVINVPQYPIDPGSANGNDFFRGSVTKVVFDPTDPTTSYAAVSDYGLYRREAGQTWYQRIYSVHFPGAAVTSSPSRLDFAATRLGARTRIYLGDATRFGETTAGLMRTDDATAATPKWHDLSSPDRTSTGYDSYNFCQQQCGYDMAVSSPPGRPDTVVLSGSMNYDEVFAAHRPSNGRAVVRSTDAGVSFTDMTNDVDNNRLHPDQHALAFLPGSADSWVVGNDGGVAVESGPFVDRSSDCESRGLGGQDLTNCRRWLSGIPTSNREVNSGLQTLQYQSIAVHGRVYQGGTVDNGTWESDLRSGPAESVGGDGASSYLDPADTDIRIHSYAHAQLDVSFHGPKPRGWDWIGDPLVASGEASSFAVPLAGSRPAPGTVFVGLQHIWRTTDNGGNRAHLDQHCNEFTGDFSGNCGDETMLGTPDPNTPGDLSGMAYGTDNAGTANYVVAITHAQRKSNILWAATRRGRLFISTNADTADPAAVSYTRLDTTAKGGPLPSRFISGISLDPANPYHAVVSYSGYSAYAAGGHLYDVTYNPRTRTVSARDRSFDLGDQPVLAAVTDWHTGTTYAATDWGVLRLPAHAHSWRATLGLPQVAVYALALDKSGTRLYAATHGLGLYVDRVD